MDIVASTSLSFLAGVAEGRSVLKHYCKSNGLEEQGVFIPSLVYGFLSFPMTVVGSSPSVELVAKYSTLQINEARHYSDERDSPTEEITLSDDLDENSTRLSSETRKMKLGLPGPGYLPRQGEEEKLVNPAGGMNVAQLREDNRRTIAAKHDRKIIDQNPINEMVNSGTHKKKDLLKMNETDITKARPSRFGNGLPTSFAQNMRRSRVLLVGYSVVSATIAYQEYNKKSENTSKSEKNVKFSGRDHSAAQSYMNCDFCEMGVALRILDEGTILNEIPRTQVGMEPKLGLVQQGTSTPCSMPIVCAPTKLSFPLNVDNRDSTPFWILGSSAEEWNELPLNNRMFLTRNDGSRRDILFESNISTSIKNGLMLQHRRDSRLRQTMECTDISSRKIQHAIANNGQGGIGITHILIGTIIDSKTKRPCNTDIIPCQRIFINSMDAIAVAITSSVNGILINRNKIEDNKKLVSTNAESDSSVDTTVAFAEKINTAKINDELVTSANPLFFVVDNIGKQLRYGGNLVINSVAKFGDAIDSFGRNIRYSSQIVLSRAGKIRTGFTNILMLSPTHRARINVFCDDASIAAWLKGILNSKELDFVWHDVRNKHSVDRMMDNTKEDDIYVILCSNDNSTVHATTSIISALPIQYHKNIISVTESFSSMDTLKAFQAHGNSAQFVCVSSIHEELFAYSKMLLTRKKLSPDKTEKMVRSKMSKRIDFSENVI